MAFNQTKINNLSKNLDLEKTIIASYLIRQAKYLKVDANMLLKSYVVLEELKKEAELRKVQELKNKNKYKTKNILISKYSEKIVNLYKEGYGTIKISNYLKKNHKATISKSALDNFLKTNELKRNG